MTFLYIDWNIKPEIFEIGSFALRWYSLCFVLAFLCGYWVLGHVFKKENRPREQVDALLLYVMIATILGARLGHYFFYEYPLLLSDPGKFFWDMLIPPYAGLASHGATIGILTGLYLFARKYKESFLAITDRVVITIALGGMFVRLGNLMNSEILGKPTDVPWAFRFLQDTEYLQNKYALLPRHPAQLYEALSCLVLFLFLFWLWNRLRRSTPHGLLLGIFLVVLFTLRFFYEFLKEDQVAFEAQMTLNMGQILSIPAVLAGIGIIVYSLKNRLKETEMKV